MIFLELSNHYSVGFGSDKEGAEEQTREMNPFIYALEKSGMDFKSLGLDRKGTDFTASFEAFWADEDEGKRRENTWALVNKVAILALDGSFPYLAEIKLRSPNDVAKYFEENPEPMFLTAKPGLAMALPLLNGGNYVPVDSKLEPILARRMDGLRTLLLGQLVDLQFREK